ncbi:MAG: GNAT family N-acetyltransferase [Clostridia bacterium]|nr:GNAT family N-acetyltransferase [Clostridia bacterium]
MSKPSFRCAVREDLFLVYRFIRDLAEYEKLTDCLITTEQDVEEWLFTKQKAEVLFIMEEEKEIGFILFFHSFPTYRHCAGLFIESLYVKPEYRGRGYGKAAFEKMARIALERGCVRIEWCCLDWNPALGFYRAIGADIMDDLTVCRLNTDGIHRLINTAIK